MNTHIFPKLIAALILATSALAAQPAWAVTDIIQCQKIVASGSYRVIANLSAPSQQDCIVIDAFNVTLDLNGHTISSDFATGTGIRDAGRFTFNIVVRNGIVSGFGKDGINLRSTDNAVVMDVTAASNGQAGISIGSGRVVNSTVVSSHAGGIAVFGAGVISGNLVRATKGPDPAIYLGSSGTVTNNTVVDAQGDGIRVDGALGALQTYVVSGNTVRGAAIVGYQIACPAMFTGNAGAGNAKDLSVREPTSNIHCTLINNALVP